MFQNNRIRFNVEGRETDTYADEGLPFLTIERDVKRKNWLEPAVRRFVLTRQEAVELAYVLTREIGIRILDSPKGLLTVTGFDIAVLNDVGEGQLQRFPINPPVHLISGDSLSVNYKFVVSTDAPPTTAVSIRKKRNWLRFWAR